MSKEEVKKVKEEKKKTIKDDDTLHPLVKPTVLTNNNEAQDEEFVEDEIDEPNSENYMYNEKEIYYTCHDMIRELNVEDLPDATGDIFVEPDCIKWDANAPLEELEKREIFTCQTLRRNTFLSNTLSMPNKDEQKLYKPQNHTRIVRFTTGVIDITDWGDSSCILLTPSETSVRTQQSRSEFPRSSIEEKKTQEVSILII
uniref:ELM2 domain-containing protein n=1 Tax=Ascaris lumbricoides TaxID=6252 RepID=A0A0M3ISF4_ASCLU